MERTRLSSGKLRAAGYDESSRTLEIEFVNGDVFEYKSVSREVYRQLMASPSPSSFFEDKIDEQFTGMRLPREGKSAAGDTFDSLFSDR
jgi:hypothetical protein